MKKSSIFKLLSAMLAVLIVAAVIGCGKGSEQKATPTPTATSSPTATTPAGQSGTLSDIEGEVQVLRSGTSAWIAAASGMKIWTGDGLKTGSDGYVLVTFFDGSVMEVDAGSEISVEELSVASGGSTTVRIHQAIGNTLNRVENLVDSSSTYEVDTRAGSAVVRGTNFNMQVNQYGGSAHTCVNTVDEEDNEDHSIDFSNSGKKVNIPEGMKACCWEGGVPSDPFYTDPTDDPLFYIGDGGGGGGCVETCGAESNDFGFGACCSHGYECVEGDGYYYCAPPCVVPDPIFYNGTWHHCGCGDNFYLCGEFGMTCQPYYSCCPSGNWQLQEGGWYECADQGA